MGHFRTSNYSPAVFLQKTQLIPSMRAPHKSPCELHYGVLLGTRRHLPSWSDGIFRPVNPQASTYNPHGASSVFMSFRDHGKVNQNWRFTTRFSPARATDPPAILKSFACTSANSPQQKPKDDSRTITSGTRKGRFRMGKTAELFFCSKGRLFQRRAHPYNILQPADQRYQKISMSKFFAPQKTSKKHLCSFLFTEKKTSFLKVPSPTPCACCTDVTTTCGFTSNNFTWARNCIPKKFWGKKSHPPSGFAIITWNNP